MTRARRIAAMAPVGKGRRIVPVTLTVRGDLVEIRPHRCRRIYELDLSTAIALLFEHVAMRLASEARAARARR